MMTLNDTVQIVIASAPVWGPLAVAGTHALLHRLPANQRSLLSDVVSTTVQGVEQMYANKPGSGEEKKAQASEFASKELSRLGIKVDPATLNVLIESAVAQLPHAPVPQPQS